MRKVIHNFNRAWFDPSGFVTGIAYPFTQSVGLADGDAGTFTYTVKDREDEFLLTVEVSRDRIRQDLPHGKQAIITQDHLGIRNKATRELWPGPRRDVRIFDPTGFELEYRRVVSLDADPAIPQVPFWTLTNYQTSVYSTEPDHVLASAGGVVSWGTRRLMNCWQSLRSKDEEARRYIHFSASSIAMENFPLSVEGHRLPDTELLNIARNIRKLTDDLLASRELRGVIEPSSDWCAFKTCYATALIRQTFFAEDTTPPPPRYLRCETTTAHRYICDQLKSAAAPLENWVMEQIAKAASK